MRVFELIALLCVLMGVGMAQTKTETPAEKEKPTAQARETTLVFAQEGERWWWAEDAEGNPLNPPRKTSDTTLVIKRPEGAEVIWVYDAKTGNLARLRAAELKDKTEFTSDRWTHVARVQVNLVAQGKPVASALVSLTDADGKTHTRVLEPSAEGILIFERVPLGKLTITTQYGDEQKASQETTLKAERELRVPVIEFALSGAVATLEPKAAAGEAAAREEASPASRVGAVVMFVVAAALAVGVIYFLVRLATQKPQQLGAAMTKLGVELPEAATGSTSPPTASATVAAPHQPELPPLESAGIPPTAAPTAGVSAGPATRLVAIQGPHSGQVFELAGELLTIGREATHPIALTADMGVSRRHAQITRQGNQTLIEDLGSTNGTYVNGVRISGPTPIKPGDAIQMGATVLRVE